MKFSINFARHLDQFRWDSCAEPASFFMVPVLGPAVILKTQDCKCIFFNEIAVFKF